MQSVICIQDIHVPHFYLENNVIPEIPIPGQFHDRTRDPAKAISALYFPARILIQRPAMCLNLTISSHLRTFAGNTETETFFPVR